MAGGDWESGRATTLLVVEDEPTLRRLLRDVLAERGFHALAAGDAAEALETARCGAIDLVIIDVMLPGRNGPALALALRERWPAVRVLFISGWGDDELRWQGIPHGAAFVPKPFTEDELIDGVRATLSAR